MDHLGSRKRRDARTIHHRRRDKSSRRAHCREIWW